MHRLPLLHGAHLRMPTFQSSNPHRPWIHQCRSSENNKCRIGRQHQSKFFSSIQVSAQNPDIVKNCLFIVFPFYCQNPKTVQNPEKSEIWNHRGLEDSEFQALTCSYLCSSSITLIQLTTSSPLHLFQFQYRESSALCFHHFFQS